MNYVLAHTRELKVKRYTCHRWKNNYIKGLLSGANDNNHKLLVNYQPIHTDILVLVEYLNKIHAA